MRVDVAIMCGVCLSHGCLLCVLVGYGHYDVRPDNFTCNASKTYYLWLDLELVGLLGERRPFSLEAWKQLPESPLVNGVYTATSDLYCFGQMLNTWGRLVESDEGKAVLQAMAQPPSKQPHTKPHSVEQLLPLATPWFQRVGVHLA
jgi:hypothetical protein